MLHKIQGNSVVGGVGKGKIKIIDCSCPEFKIHKVEDSDKELGRFVRALKTFCDNTRKQIAHLEKTVGHTESQILEGHIKMTHDLALQSELITRISNGTCAEQATCEICDTYIKRFLDTDIDFVRQLYLDVLDVEVSVVKLLLEIPEESVEHFDEDVIIAAYELTPSVVARLDREHVKGIVVDFGSSNSHGAKLAKTMNIPSVAAVKSVDKLVCDGQYAELDADNGVLYY